MHTMTGWTLSEWQDAYRKGESPHELLGSLLEEQDPQDPAWICLATREQLHEQINELSPDQPLYGIPFAIKDNIDARGFDTTAACRAYSYQADGDAEAVEALKKAGAVLIGKTNLDQFATGLVGTRSPWGVVPNTFDDRIISGGSSSGSAVVVARGTVPFSLGTDTAGSGRVPAGLNNIVGLKPTRGAISTKGVVPACRSLDCVSIFAHTTTDAGFIRTILEAGPCTDAMARARPEVHARTGCSLRTPGPIRRLAIPSQPQWFEDHLQQAAWRKALDQWETLGVELVPQEIGRAHV